MQKSKYWLHYFIVLQVISMAATLYQSLAFGEILGRFNASAQIFGITSALSVFALALGLPFGGYLVDKIGGTRTFLFAQKISIFSNLLSIPLFYFHANLSIWIMYQIFCGLISSIEISSRQHFIFDNMPNNGAKKGLSTVSFDISLNGFAKIIGYSLGAKLLENSNPLWAFIFNAATFLIMAIWINKNLSQVVESIHKIKTKVDSFPLSIIWSNQFLRKLLICETVFSFCLFSINTQAYLLIKELNVPYNFGWLFVAASTGNFLVNILYTRKHGFRFKSNTILFGVMALIGLLLLVWHANFWICLFGVFLTGASLTNFSITTRSQLHENSNMYNKGAIFSVFLINWNIWTGLSALIFGFFVQSFGFTISFFILFITLLTFLIYFIYNTFNNTRVKVS